VTLHGFALNCSTDLSWYGAIVPCGLEDRGVTSLTDIAGRTITPDDALPAVIRGFEAVFGLRLVPQTLETAALSEPAPATSTSSRGA